MKNCLLMALVFSAGSVEAGTQSVNPGVPIVATTSISVSVVQPDSDALPLLVVLPPSGPGGEFTFRLRGVE